MVGKYRLLRGGLVILTMLILISAAASAADVPTVNWTKLSPATSPSARAYPAMAYDPVSKKVVLFGGYSGVYLNDTWTFDGATWTKVNTPTAPPVRTNGPMAFDRVTRQLVLFGGYNGSKDLGDTWTWDGSTSTWAEQHPTTSPKAVTGPMLFSDPANGHADVYGGFDGNLYQLTTFQWTGTNWKQVRTSTSASARSIAVAATDAATKSTVLFDGLGDVNPYNTWTFDGSNWTELTLTAQPPSRYGSPGAYDPRLKAVIVFGGGEGGSDINDTWAWTGTAWKQLSPAQSPSAREGYGMAYDAAIGHIVIFGGEAGASIFSDTWELTPR
jgi:hypothetical protein